MIRLTALLALTLSLSLGCATPPVLEQQDVSNFQTHYNAALDTLSFKGIYAQTPLQSKKISTEQIGEDLFVKLQVSAVPGLGFNDFEYAVQLSEDINRVYFGNRKDLIWQRNKD